MATIYVDPTALTNGNGNFATPRNIFPTSLAYGDIVLFKEKTVYNGSWTLPTPSGTGSNTNRVTLGTYDATTGLKTNNLEQQASIKSVATNTDAIFISSVSYITVSSLHCISGNNFPYAGVRALNSSYITVEFCTIENMDGLLGAYGIRFDNATGSGSARSNWVIKNNIIKNIAGNAGILCVWSSTSGEYVSNITVENNTITSLRYLAGSTAHGITINARASTIYTDKDGFCAKGVKVVNNTISKTPGYAIQIKGVNTSSTSQNNLVAGNTALDIGNGIMDMHCIWLGACYNVQVLNNKVHRSTAKEGGATGTGVGIFIDIPTSTLDGCEDILISRNIVTATGRGSSQNDEVGGAGIFILHSRRVTISYNIVQYCLNGIVVWGGNTSGDKSTNINVYNNTLAHNDGPGIYVCKIVDVVNVKNNLLYRNTTGIYTETSGAGAITNYTEQYNLAWENTNNWTEGNAPTTTVATITTRTPDASNLETDPEINQTYNISSTGAAYQAGTSVSSKYGLSGLSYTTTPSIGAYEYIPVRGTR